MAKNMIKNLEIKMGFEKPEVKILQRENVAYIKFASFPSYPLQHKFIGEYLIVHIDKKKKEILGFTITDLSSYIEEKQYLKEKAKENVSKTLQNTKRFAEVLPLQVISQLHIRI